MPFQSPLTNLCDVLRQNTESAKLYRETLKKNEAATRAVLIDPVLRALGWDTANIDMVEVEKTQNGVQADYALYSSDSEPKIIVEAKPLGTDLSQKKVVMSLMNYACGFEVKELLLTDGLVWHHFSNFDNFQPTTILDIDSNGVVSCAAYLVQHLDAAKFWPVEQDIDDLSQRIEELESVVSTLQKNVSTLLSDRTAEVAITQQNQASRQARSLNDLKFVALSKLDSGVTGSKPSHYRLPDGEILEIKNWKEVLRESCKFVLDNNLSISLPFSDVAGRKISLINTTKPSRAFVTTLYREQSVYIYHNYSAYDCVRNAIHILGELPQSLGKAEPAVVFKKDKKS